MKVKELKILLKQYSDDMDVFIGERVTEFSYGLLNSVSSKNITFSEDVDNGPMAEERVVVLSEE